MRGGRHWTGWNSSNIGMVSSIGHKEDGLVNVVVKDRRDDSQIGQMRTPFWKKLRIFLNHFCFVPKTPKNLPAWGWLANITSPGCRLSPRVVIWYLTVLCIAPRWTGICGALETRPPSGPNKAQLKSNLSLMLVEMEVRWRILPICSEIWEARESGSGRKQSDEEGQFLFTCYWHKPMRKNR